MARLTYSTKQMDDAKNHRGSDWEKGTLRIFHADDRQRWSVCQKGCDDYGTALVSWGEGGEFFDGKQWLPLSQWTRDVLQAG